MLQILTVYLKYLFIGTENIGDFTDSFFISCGNGLNPFRCFVFFDGGQFAQIGKATRRIMVPFLYIAMKSLYWSKGKMLKRIMWCDDGKIKLQMHLLSEN